MSSRVVSLTIVSSVGVVGERLSTLLTYSYFFLSFFYYESYFAK